MNCAFALILFSSVTFMLNTESFPVRSCEDILATANSTKDGAIPPSIIDVNQCSENNSAKEKGDFECSINETLCESECPVLGRERDSKGCITSCECRTNGLFEGDIRFNADNRGVILQNYERGNWTIDKGISVGLRQWPVYVNGRCQVPYTTSFNMIDSGISALNTAISRFSQFTCIDLIPRTTEANYIQFIKGSGCWSYVGRQNGLQQISIGSGCEYPGTVQHEIMHALGFWHEQSRSDRDTYVTINFNNIQTNKENNFQKHTTNSMGSPYDISSVMHYSGYAFTKNGQPTIVEIATGNAVVANRINFSVEDIKQINLFYGCTSTTAAPVTTGPTTDGTTAITTTTSGGTTTSGTTTGGTTTSGTTTSGSTTMATTTVQTTTAALRVFSSIVTPVRWACKGMLIPGDFNGDGMQDLACYNNRNQKLKISYGTASGQFPRFNWSGPVRFCNGYAKTAPVISGDFNGDGFDDLLCRDIATGEIRTSFSTGNGFRKLVDWSDFYPTFCTVKKSNLSALDINGDGLDDIVCSIKGSITVLLNEFNG